MILILVVKSLFRAYIFFSWPSLAFTSLKVLVGKGCKVTQVP